MSSCSDAGNAAACVPGAPGRGARAAPARKFPLAGSSASYGVIVGELISSWASASWECETSCGPTDGEDAAGRAVPQMPQKDSPLSKKSLPQTEHTSPLRATKIPLLGAIGGSSQASAGFAAATFSDSDSVPRRSS